MVKHNTKLDKLGKQYLPEGFRLDVDRGTTAKTVYDRKEVYKWREATNKSDLKGFDTKSARERPSSSIIKKIRGIRGRTGSGEDAIMDDPDRFVKYGQETRTLLEEVKNEIYDFQSFKVAVNKAWSKDSSLCELLANVHRDDVWDILFNTSTIQGWVKDNTDSVGIDLIMRKYNIEKGRATKIFNRLDVKSRQRLFRNTKVGIRVKPRELTIVKPKIPMLRQKSKGGNFYQRTMPKRWSKLEVRLLINNKGKKFSQITDIYRKVFSGKARTDNSIRNKLYRVK